MNTKDTQISFVGMEPTEALKKYVLEKISKHENLFSEATSLEVVMRENKLRKGVKEDFRIDINVNMPNTPVRVEVVGEDMYANIDSASDTLARRLKRYGDKKNMWEGETPWKVLEAEAALEALAQEEEEPDNYMDYVPKIAVRKKIEDLSPIEEAEAIEKMELLGYDQLLFRNRTTGKLSMIYRRKRGGYGLVEPADGIE